AITDTYVQGSAGTLDISIGGTMAGQQYDQVNVTSSASLGGTLNVTLVNNFTPTVGATFDLVNASSLSGTFVTANLPSLGGGDQFCIAYDSTDVDLTVVSGSCPPSKPAKAGPTHPALSVGGKSARPGRGGNLIERPSLTPRLGMGGRIALLVIP